MTCEGKRPRIALVAGERGSGKTTALSEAARLASSRALAVGGILCPSRRDARGLPVEVEALSAATGERRPLASRDSGLEGPTWPPPGPGLAPSFHFSAATFAWALAELRAALSRDLLVLDEVGPLELRLGEGFRPFVDELAAAWASGLEARAPGPGLVAIAVRPALASELRDLLGGATILELDASTRSGLPAEIAALAAASAREKRSASG